MKKAAFFRVEGTLFPLGAFRSFAYLAANRQGFRERLMRLGQVVLSAPASKFFGVQLLALCLEGMSKDRISIIGEEYFHDILHSKLFGEGMQLIEDCRKQGFEIVLLSEEIAEVIEPLKEEFKEGVHLICNRLEYEKGHATGKLKEPKVGGYTTGSWLVPFAAQNKIDLLESLAYAASGPDLLLLSGVGHPCAVNPDFTLRQAAHDAKWPVLEYRA